MKLRDEIMKRCGCVPPYWEPLDSNETSLPNCNSKEQLKGMADLLGKHREVIGSYNPPCNEMKVVSNVQEKELPYLSRFLQMEVSYMDEDYEEIVNEKDFNIESFFSGIGGFVGIILGYSIMHIPELLSAIWKFINNKLGKHPTVTSSRSETISPVAVTELA